jgi:hypothetical protein
MSHSSQAQVRWVSIFLDTTTERSAESERFWAEVTGQPLSAPWGHRGEFGTYLPDDGDPYLRVQRVGQSGPGGLHVDLQTDDVAALATRAEALGASASYPEDGLVVLGSPGGMSFCIVGNPGSRRPAPKEWPAGRSIADQVCIDIPPSRFDAERAFWAELTGWEVRTGDRPEFVNLVRPDGMPVQFLLQRLDEEQPVVTCHIDFSCDDMEAEGQRHLDLGAREVRRTPHWITLVDPVGRVYCVTRRKAGAISGSRERSSSADR